VKLSATFPSLILAFFLVCLPATSSSAGAISDFCNGEPNGILDGLEQCETGPCCSKTCELLSGDTVCHEGTDPICDPEATCGEQEVTVLAECPSAAGADGLECDDGLFCTVDDECSGGICSGALRPCGDDNSCTDDACNEIDDKCDHLSNTVACDDGVFCNGADSCESGECAVHAGDPCDGSDGDGNCAEGCDEELDACTAKDEDDSPCSDGLVCTDGDTCADGVCVPGASVDECTEPTTTTTEEPVTTTTLIVTTTTTEIVTTTTMVVDPCGLCGDITCDGRLTVRDAYLILRAAVGLPSTCTLHVCDFTGDEEISSTDALAVLRAAVGLEVTPSCPAENQEEVGLDATDQPGAFS
jgi:hypothetical protein